MIIIDGIEYQIANLKSWRYYKDNKLYTIEELSELCKNDDDEQEDEPEEFIIANIIFHLE